MYNKKLKREILFRGKSKYADTWYIGFLERRKSNTFVIRTEDLLTSEILTETVGQYTGENDRNDERVFEGDIVKLYHGALGAQGVDGALYKVEFMEGAFWLVSVQRPIRGIRIFDELSQIEVVGNIYDNPELLR